LGGISGKTAVFCVLGHPIGHSLSPAMHNAALREMGVDGVYVAFDVAPGDLPAALAGLRALGVRGVNCTIPHKEALVPLMDELTPEAAAIGAVNTVQFRDGRMCGHNTDAPGFLAALRAEGVEPADSRAVVLGAGGSARAVVCALAGVGARVALANRTVERAAELAEHVNGRLSRSLVRGVGLEEGVLRSELEGADLLVNTTSLGMSPHPDALPPVPATALGPGLFVYDLIYNPRETRLLRLARECGARGQNGAGMLARQGALALELWTGRPVPAALMEAVVTAAVAGA
jgi:shikimate dehydrogenase